jgi:glycine betaine/proline transport system ATP-binding protein
MADEKLIVRNLYKIFGEEPDRALELLKQGRSKDEILKETGMTVGVQDCSFTVNKGEIFVVMGLSGSGKSTLVRMLNRLIDPTAGDVLIDGDAITGADMEAVRNIRLRKMSMVFQHFALFPHLTVAENVAYPLKIRGEDEETRRQKAMKSLEQVGLAYWADRPPSALSGGMQQRVGLARGLCADPEVLLMDEPFSALDPLIRSDMQQELLELQKSVHKTIVFITHDLDEALILGDRIAIMKDGQFVQVGTAQDIVSDPQDDYVAAFTQGIDRGRVFTTDWVMRDPKPLDLGKDNADSALKKLDELNADGLFVMDGEKIAGVVTYSDVAHALSKNQKEIKSLLHTDYPTTTADSHLHELYEHCSKGLPIAVLDDQGKLRAAVDPREVFYMLVPDKEMPSEKAKKQQQGSTSGQAGAGTDKAAAQA